MSYLPLARKYRPQTFDELIGQPHVTTTLARAIESQRVAQAYLFVGLRGVGKTSAARILAKCLECADGPTARPCNRCASCAQITQGNSLDVIEIDGASNRGIEEIRSLRESVPYAPTTGPFRIYIIDEVHMLTPEAFNALLKTLEEPPAHVKFIFATTAAAKVPATVLSRCQRFDFRRIDEATIVKALRRVAEAERIDIGDPALYAVARASDGSLRDAEVVLEQLRSFVSGPIQEVDVTSLLGTVEAEALFAWTQAMLDRKTPEALAFLFQQLDQGRDAQQLLMGLVRHVRNLVVLRSTADAPSRGDLLARLVDEPEERLKRLDAQAAGASAAELLLMLQILTGAYELVRRSPMAQTVLELTVVKLSTREEWQSLDAISRRLEQLASPSHEASPHACGADPAAASAPSPSGHEATAAQPSGGQTSSGSAPADLAALWPVLLEQLGAKKMSLAAYLADSKPLRLEGGRVTIGVQGFSLHQEVLNLVENRRLIAGLLSELCHATVGIEYVTLAEPPAPIAPSAPPAPPVVQEIVNLFNATLLDRPRR